MFKKFIKNKNLKFCLRPMCKYINNNYNGKDLIGFEIGVFKGENARNMLNFMRIKKLYLIDSYHIYTEEGRTRNYNHKDIYDIAMSNLKKHLDNGKVEFIIDKSNETSMVFNDNYFDFGYIDGNHTYEFVKKDIELYFPKIKPGGVLGGHDFMLRRYPGVCKAVSDFIIDNDIEIHFSQDSDWWIVKK